MKLLGKNHPIPEHTEPCRHLLHSDWSGHPRAPGAPPACSLGHLDRGSLGDTGSAGKPLLRGLSGDIPGLFPRDTRSRQPGSKL